ncbi:MAG TPA: hypothetical protein VG844_15080 [Terracidiphilus sp.]|jgi:hypothetical protein|nr:hypothetical protein [Terracidiphilus sp.]
MGIFNSTKPKQSAMCHSNARLCVLAVLALGAACTFAHAVPQKPASATHASHHKASAKKADAKSAEETKPATPPQPEMPKWPVNDSPEPAKVTWDSHGLEIHATNSSLMQILHDYSVATGSKIEGISKDERIFGTYGPGSAHDVLTQLLNGTGYNVLMFGDLGQGTPREVVLSARSADNGPRPMAHPMPAPSYDDAEDNTDDQPEPPPQPVMQPQVIQPNMPPGNQPVRTPQQIMEEMQRRQQQLQQQQDQQNPQ